MANKRKRERKHKNQIGALKVVLAQMETKLQKLLGVCLKDALT